MGSIFFRRRRNNIPVFLREKFVVTKKNQIPFRFDALILELFFQGKANEKES